MAHHTDSPLSHTAIRANLRFWCARLLRGIQRLLFFLPIRQHAIAVYLHARRGYCCNVKYIVEALRIRHPETDITWITEFPEAVSELPKRGIRVVRLNSFRHWWYQFTAKVILTSDAFPVCVRLRRGQITANAWHAGMNYKHIGPAHCAFEHPAQAKNFAIANVQPHHYFSGSAFFTEDVCASFGFKAAVFRPFGQARNDIFFNENTALCLALRQQYGLTPETKTVLYAPTFRNHKQENLFDLDFKRLNHALTAQFGGSWQVLYRNHYFVSSEGHAKDCGIIDVSDYADMNELLAITDVLISDYSSCLWDFALTGKPSFVYATDVDTYATAERSFAYPLNKWPYPICRNNDELEAAIQHFDSDLYCQKVRAHLNDCGTYDTGSAANQAADLLAAELFQPHNCV
ncbi:MAG: CDP-glycerol glycerophosphotransferase family protein [Kiritimatiellae bacterium]|nr:CDP-glycerol glycerophosphotransferase family protein [Kiritimatiellia bacterium]